MKPFMPPVAFVRRAVFSNRQWERTTENVYRRRDENGLSAKSACRTPSAPTFVNVRIYADRPSGKRLFRGRIIMLFIMPIIMPFTV
ncbi:MAG TPA: hypothetical protein DEB39_07540 [Planctomycetaceae bacterium]|nr:hypothetical protein [Planctomycetaceae bacterium]